MRINGALSFQPEPLDDEWVKWLVGGEWEGWGKSDKGEHKDWNGLRYGIYGVEGNFYFSNSDLS